MLTVDSTPMEIDTYQELSKDSPFKPRSPRKNGKKTKLRKPRQKWHCSDLTAVSQQDGSVKLTNRLFDNDESCSDSMYELHILNLFLKGPHRLASRLRDRCESDGMPSTCEENSQKSQHHPRLRPRWNLSLLRDGSKQRIWLQGRNRRGWRNYWCTFFPVLVP